jgi:hypothetical protein
MRAAHRILRLLGMAFDQGGSKLVDLDDFGKQVTIKGAVIAAGILVNRVRVGGVELRHE